MLNVVVLTVAIWSVTAPMSTADAIEWEIRCHASAPVQVCKDIANIFASFDDKSTRHHRKKIAS